MSFNQGPPEENSFLGSILWLTGAKPPSCHTHILKPLCFVSISKHRAGRDPRVNESKHCTMQEIQAIPPTNSSNDPCSISSKGKKSPEALGQKPWIWSKIPFWLQSGNWHYPGHIRKGHMSQNSFLPSLLWSAKIHRIRLAVREPSSLCFESFERRAPHIPTNLFHWGIALTIRKFFIIFSKKPCFNLISAIRFALIEQQQTGSLHPLYDSLSNAWRWLSFFILFLLIFLTQMNNKQNWENINNLSSHHKPLYYYS